MTGGKLQVSAGHLIQIFFKSGYLRKEFRTTKLFGKASDISKLQSCLFMQKGRERRIT